MRAINTEPLIIFNHIHKTGGSYFRKAIIEANISPEHIYRHDGNLRKFMIDMNKKDYKVVAGHIPYGLHHFTVRPVHYITFLREPIDRAISQYFFLRSPNALLYGKPIFYDYANSVSLKEYYQDPRFHNWQTRFIAGFISNKIYPIFQTPLLNKIILNRAIKNISCHYYGIVVKENYEQSLQILQSKLGWNKRNKVERKKLRITDNKPRLEDIDQETISVIRKANTLDIEIYNYVTNHM